MAHAPHSREISARKGANFLFIDAKASAAATIAAATWPDFSDGNLGPDSKDDNLGPDSTDGNLGPDSTDGNLRPDSTDGNLGPDSTADSPGRDEVATKLRRSCDEVATKLLRSSYENQTHRGTEKAPQRCHIT